MEEKRKISHNKKGFTLAETLLAVLIMLLVSLIVATGIPAVKNAYEKVVLASNAEVLLSTTVSILRNELGTAREIEVSSDGNGDTVITYLSSARGGMSKIYLGSDGDDVDTIMFLRYAQVEGIGADSKPEQLVSKETATGDLYITYDSVTYENNIITIKNLSVNRASGTEGLAKRDSLSIRAFSH